MQILYKSLCALSLNKWNDLLWFHGKLNLSKLINQCIDPVTHAQKYIYFCIDVHFIPQYAARWHATNIYIDDHSTKFLKIFNADVASWLLHIKAIYANIVSCILHLRVICAHIVSWLSDLKDILGFFLMYASYFQI